MTDTVRLDITNTFRLVDKSDNNNHWSPKDALEEAIKEIGDAKSVLVIFDNGTRYRTIRAGLRKPDELYMLEWVKRDLL